MFDFSNLLYNNLLTTTAIKTPIKTNAILIGTETDASNNIIAAAKAFNVTNII